VGGAPRLALATGVPVASGCGSHHVSAPPRPPAGEGSIARWSTDEHLPRQALGGARIFALAGCLNCHVYDGDGGQSYSARDLTAVGRGRTSVSGFARYLANPARSGNQVMPAYGKALSGAQLAALGRFLAASRGTR
jgi:mono/diheme cytochrome c family protein